MKDEFNNIRPIHKYNFIDWQILVNPNSRTLLYKDSMVDNRNAQFEISNHVDY